MKKKSKLKKNKNIYSMQLFSANTTISKKSKFSFAHENIKNRPKNRPNFFFRKTAQTLLDSLDSQD